MASFKHVTKIVLLTSASETLFKHSKLSYYSLKMSKFSISKTLYYTNFHKKLLFKVLNKYPETLVNISLQK